MATEKVIKKGKLKGLQRFTGWSDTLLTIERGKLKLHEKRIGTQYAYHQTIAEFDLDRVQELINVYKGV